MRVSPALLACLVSFALTGVTPAAAQGKQRNLAERCTKEDFAKRNPKSCAQFAKPAEAAKQPEQPSRSDFTAEDQAAAVIPGIPDARFWADSEKDFLAALPTTPGPWLALSTGGGDGAFGAGLLNGWSESGKRPEFSVVTGVSTGALMAPYAFVGSAQDPGLKRAYTEYNAGDIFEDVKTPESLVDTWPLKRLIGKEVTPELLAQVAEAHKRGRRLFVATTNLDANRGVIWNMGAIASKSDEVSLELFRNVLRASTAIPGLFPPVLIDVEANGKKTQEMHADGGLTAQIFVAPESMLNTSSTTKLPATELYLIANNRLTPEFQMTERSLIFVIGHSIAVGVQSMLRVNIDRAYAAAKRNGIPFYLAYPALAADQQGKGAFDPEFMKDLFQSGVARGRGESPFVQEAGEALRGSLSPGK
ncbi:MAG: patatin-like phospholipase family protein [Xanthobacteraceae bacterium]